MALSVSYQHNIGQLYPVDWLEGEYLAYRSSHNGSGDCRHGSLAGCSCSILSLVQHEPAFSDNCAIIDSHSYTLLFKPGYTIDSEIISNPFRFDVNQAPHPIFLWERPGTGNTNISLLLPRLTTLDQNKKNWTQYLVSPVGNDPRSGGQCTTEEQTRF